MSYDIVIEDVPRYVRRVGDQVIQGSNNSCIILGTDRARRGPAGLSDGMGSLDSPGGGKRAGSIYAVVGRSDESGNPDLSSDLSYLHLSMKTDIDQTLGLESIEEKAPVSPAATIRSDGVRLVAARDVKIAIEGSRSYIWIKKDEVVLRSEKASVALRGDRIVVDAGRVELGEGATERLMLGDSFKRFFLEHVHPTAAGISGPPSRPWIDSQLLSQRSIFAR